MSLGACLTVSKVLIKAEGQRHSWWRGTAPTGVLWGPTSTKTPEVPCEALPASVAHFWGGPPPGPSPPSLEPDPGGPLPNVLRPTPLSASPPPPHSGPCPHLAIVQLPGHALCLPLPSPGTRHPLFCCLRKGSKHPGALGTPVVEDLLWLPRAHSKESSPLGLPYQRPRPWLGLRAPHLACDVSQTPCLSPHSSLSLVASSCTSWPSSPGLGLLGSLPVLREVLPVTHADPLLEHFGGVCVGGRAGTGMEAQEEGGAQFSPWSSSAWLHLALGGGLCPLISPLGQLGAVPLIHPMRAGRLGWRAQHRSRCRCLCVGWQFPSPGPRLPAAADATPLPSSTWLPKGGGVGVQMKSWMGAEPDQGFQVVTLTCCRGQRGPGSSPRLFGDAAVMARGSAAGVEPYL